MGPMARISPLATTGWNSMHYSGTLTQMIGLVNVVRTNMVKYTSSLGAVGGLKSLPQLMNLMVGGLEEADTGTRSCKFEGDVI